MKDSNLLKIAIVGRPNVGKSSLFNRLVGSRRAIVEPVGGTTRDRIEAKIKWKGRGFTIIDMAGYHDDRMDTVSALTLKQFRKGVEEADVILFITDGMSGLTPLDRKLASTVRKASKKIYLAVNKIDREADEFRAADFYALGLGAPYPVSAMHARGIDRLLNDLVSDAKNVSEACGEVVKVAIVGRPNVGKSSYLNAILREERVIVHPIAGTTRDSIDTDFNYKGRDYVLIDTAGIRHNSKIKRAADFYGGVRTEEAIRRSDIVIMLIDGYEGPAGDDGHIIDLCASSGKPIVIAVNKWDLVKNTEMSKYHKRLIDELGAVGDIPVIFISAKSGRNIYPSLDLARSVYEKSRKAIPQERLAETLKLLNNAPQVKGRMIKLKCLVQEETKPPSFVLATDDKRRLTDNVKRLIENLIRKNFGLAGAPIRIRYR